MPASFMTSARRPIRRNERRRAATAALLPLAALTFALLDGAVMVAATECLRALGLPR